MTDQTDIPDPLRWDQRTKSVEPMPGGQFGYLEALRKLCQFVVGQSPTHAILVDWIQDHLTRGEKYPDDVVRFLGNAGVLVQTAGQYELSLHASRWLESEDDGILIALLHSQVQFVGEMLAEIDNEPQSIEELRIAASGYGLNWGSKNQIRRRRGWMVSAKMIEADGAGHLTLTDAGRDLLAKLVVHSSGSKPGHSRSQLPSEPQSDNTPTPTPSTTQSTLPTESDDTAVERDSSPAEALANEIGEAATDSRNPDRLEIAVRDAFHFLGFEAEKLGGRGKTDVLVNAPLGKNDSYTVTIDAKTVGATKTAGAGSLEDRQVDWVTLEEHRKQHDADYSMLVGPNPSGQRLMDRAFDKKVAVLSTDQLAELCLQHADAPLGLQDYRALFESGGAVDTVSIGKAAQDLTRLRDLAVEICSKLAERTGAFGPLTAPQLMVMLGQPDKPSSEQEIQQVLDTLASPLMGAIQGKASEGYVLATAPRVIQQRLQLLGDQLAR